MGDMSEVSGGPPAFELMDCAPIMIATGRKAWTVKELRDGLTAVDSSCIYHHFWAPLLAPRFREREYNNDFASWMWHEAGMSHLAERLAVVDPTAFDDLDALRRTLVDIIDDDLDVAGEAPWLRAASPFQFVRSQLVIFRTGRQVQSVHDLAELTPELSDGSIFYHLVDARRRTSDGVDDFRAWLRDMPGEDGMVDEELADVDPYFTTMAELRRRLAGIFRRRAERAQ